MGMIFKSSRIVTWLCVVISTTASPSPAAAFRSGDEAIVANILSAPAWSSINRDNIDESGSRLIAALKELQKLPEDRVEAIVKRLIVESERLGKGGFGSIEIESKLYVLNRFYCNVPERAKVDESKVFGGWFGVPQSDGYVNPLWPLAYKEDGDQLRIVGEFGGYYGPPYRALEEFDYLLTTYGPRKIPR